MGSRRGVDAAMRIQSLPMETAEYDPLYLQGIEHFNVCDFYESHEVWEELWTDHHGPNRKFYQGLIQVAVALHHFGNGNIRGARKLFVGCQAYLDPYRPKHLGLDLEQFLAQLTVCFSEVMASSEEFPQIEIDPERIPEIHLDPPPA
jgi:predicted metal-dependent hydrolase